MIRKQLNNKVLALTILIVAILLFTAYAKIFYPMRFVEKLQMSAGVFEVIFAGLLIAFYRKWWIWIAAMAVFGAWGGYTYFWMISKLPCGCMGEFYAPPTHVTFFVDLALFIASAVAAVALGAKRIVMVLAMIVSLSLGVGGYLFGQHLRVSLQEAKLHRQMHSSPSLKVTPSIGIHSSSQSSPELQAPVLPHSPEQAPVLQNSPEQPLAH
jgi:hypothetical protein